MTAETEKLPDAIITQILDQLEIRFPSIADVRISCSCYHSMEFCYYDNTDDEYTAHLHLGLNKEDDFWQQRATFLLLVLAAEGIEYFVDYSDPVINKDYNPTTESSIL